MKYTKKMTLAFWRTVRALERLEQKPETYPKWKEFGTVTGCRLCKAAGLYYDRYAENPHCEKCPLGGDPGDQYLCIELPAYRALSIALCKARHSYPPVDTEPVREAAQAAITTLRKIAKEKGVEDE